MTWLLILIINGMYLEIPVATEPMCEAAVRYFDRNLKSHSHTYRMRNRTDYLLYGCFRADRIL